MLFIYAVLITYGVSLIIVHGTIFSELKQYIKDMKFKNRFLNATKNKFIEMVNCMICVSFWIGALVGGYFGLLPWYNIFLNGGLLTATTWIIHCVMSFIGNGYDPGRVFNITITEPVKIETSDKKIERINKADDLQIFKG